MEKNNTDKIYRRSTQRGGTPKHKKNEKNRKRNVILNFRVSPLEKELIEKRIKLSGMAKGEFFIESCLYQAIFIKGNVKTFTEIKNEMKELAEILNRDPNLEKLDPVHLESIQTILEILNHLF